MVRRSHIFVVLAALSLPTVAAATPEFPAEIQAHLNLSYQPACAVCHAGTPGAGTATTLFAMTLKSHGLVPYSNGSLDTALDDIKAANTSSAGDGISDIQKLENGEDPNSVVGEGGVQATPFPPPDYGCNVGRGRISFGSLGAALGVLGIAAGTRRRSRRGRASADRAA